MEEIDEALERLEVEPIRVEMRCEISGEMDVRIQQFCLFGCSTKMLFICLLSSFFFCGNRGSLDFGRDGHIACFRYRYTFHYISHVWLLCGTLP